MCLGIPGQVVAKVDGYGDQAALAPGDWVLIHMGFVVGRVDQAGADKAMAGLELMGRPRDQEAP